MHFKQNMLDEQRRQLSIKFEQGSHVLLMLTATSVLLQERQEEILSHNRQLSIRLKQN